MDSPPMIEQVQKMKKKKILDLEKEKHSKVMGFVEKHLLK